MVKAKRMEELSEGHSFKNVIFEDKWSEVRRDKGMQRRNREDKQVRDKQGQARIGQCQTNRKRDEMELPK